MQRWSPWVPGHAPLTSPLKLRGPNAKQIARTKSHRAALDTIVNSQHGVAAVSSYFISVAHGVGNDKVSSRT